jgi:hypothetical protein
VSLRWSGTKSSADSISNFPAESGREAVAINPSGLPVLKKNGPAYEIPTVTMKVAADAIAWMARRWNRLVRVRMVTSLWLAAE